MFHGRPYGIRAGPAMEEGELSKCITIKEFGYRPYFELLYFLINFKC